MAKVKRSSGRAPGTRGARRASGAGEPAGFRLGDHTFDDADSQGPDPRFAAILSGRPMPKPRQILGAPPPTYLDGFVRESTRRSPAAKELLRGRFCGHGETTMTVFDVVIDGQTELELDGIGNDEGDERNFPLVAARRPGGEWVVLFRRAWEESQETLMGIKRSKVSKAEMKRLTEPTPGVQISIGFEYPSDADSRDCVTWLTIDALFKGKSKPICMVNAELA
ncbi:MAG: hypothetical protein JNM07_03390 [Phycisphaerae bacterium]|nr:hypothetical protein [Phycisphaerae bacterium]